MKTKFYLLFCIFMLAFLPATVFCQTAGPNNAGTGANVSISYNPSWNYPGNITTPGSPYSWVTISSTKCDDGSDYLRGTNYGFSIPAGATITGIQVTVNRKGDQGCYGTGIQDKYLYLVKGVNGSPVIQTAGSNKASAAVWPTSMTTATYGSSADLWNLSWTVEDINSMNFGVALAVQSNAYYNVTATVDYMQITVSYSLPSPPTITGFTPNNGCAGSGTSVVITGTNFTGTSAVTFYNSQTAVFTVNSSTQITATLPAGAATGAISVTTPAGTAATPGNFTVNELPQGSLAANGPFCASGTGFLTFTATAGTGPFTIVYNDGTADRTQTNVTSGTSFEAYTNPVTSTTSYTLVSVTGANTCARTGGFTGAQATLTIDQPPAPDAGVDVAQCNLLSYTLDGNAPESGTGLWTGPSGVAFDDATKPNALVSGLTPGDNVLTWTITNGACSNSDDVLVNIYEGVSVSGSFTYYNPVPTKPITHVTVELYKNGEFVESTSTGNGDSFTFPNVCPGNYEVKALSSDPTGGINSTDAALMNYWSVNPSQTQKVRFIAGDVAGGLPQCQGTPDNSIISLDAQRVHVYFISNGAAAFDRLPWSFWKAGETVSANSVPTCVQQYPTIIVENTPVSNLTFYGLCTGDFNQSFVPATEMKSSNPGIRLVPSGTIAVAAGEEFELPVTAVTPFEAIAVSLILKVPSELADVTGVSLNTGTGQPDWAVNGDELRIAWSSLDAVQVTEGEKLLTLTLKANHSIPDGKNIRVTLADNSLNEIADRQFNPLPGTVLGIADAVPGKGTGLVLESYPNPCAENTEIRYTLPFSGTVTLQLTSITGACLYSELLGETLAGSHLFNLNTSALEPGAYIVTLTLNGQHDLLVRHLKLVRNR